VTKIYERHLTARSIGAHLLTPAPIPVPTLPQPVPPVVIQSPELDSALLAQAIDLLKQAQATNADTNAKVTHIDGKVTFAQQFRQAMTFAAKYIAPTIAAWLGGKAMTK
jgi:hypothetical protein